MTDYSKLSDKELLELARKEGLIKSELKLNHIYQGDNLSILKTFPDESIDCCITSPPYWALRDYDIDGQLGLEKTFQEYINKLCDIYDEIKRILKKNGTCWVNLGDTYWGGGNNRGSTAENLSKKQFSNRGARGQVQMKWSKDYQSKCLCMIPERFALEMINRGWILRNQIIWYKRNAMPSSVKDRFTVDFEKIFFFVKNKKYYFKQQREPHIWAKRDKRSKLRRVEHKSGKSTLSNAQTGCKAVGYHPKGRNKRTVWDIPTKPFKGAHFAVFPETLVEPMIKSGCPKNGIVLDPFMGSGTTSIVAKKLNRNFIGIELNPNYIKIAEKRLSTIDN